MAGAAGWDGCVDGSGRVRRKATSGTKVERRDGGKGLMVISEPGAGVDPEEPSATSFVYSWASFLAPVSTRRA